MRVFICGPMDFMPTADHSAFVEAAEALRDRGFVVGSPAEIMATESTSNHETCMRACLAAALQCGAVVTLPGASKDSDCRVILQAAKAAGVKVEQLAVFLRQHHNFATLEAQLEAFDRRVDAALDFAVYVLKHHRHKIKALARERLIAGFAEYGAGSWSKSQDALWQEALEEAADQTVYHTIHLELREVEDLTRREALRQ